MMFLITIICIIMVVIFYLLYEMIKGMYAVRKFFNNSNEIEKFYELFILKKYNNSALESLQEQITTEDIHEVLNLAEKTIAIYDKNCFKEVDEPKLNSTYYNLKEIATELRRKLLWNN